jgi:hypothetical protein
MTTLANWKYQGAQGHSTTNSEHGDCIRDCKVRFSLVLLGIFEN